MSASLTKRNALPAAIIALAVTAGAPAAQAGGYGPQLDIGFFADQQDSLAPVAGGDSAGVLDWLVTLRSTIVAAADDVAETQARVFNRLQILANGRAAVDVWLGQRTQTIIALANDIGANVALIGGGDASHANAATAVLAAISAIQNSIDGSFVQAGSQLTGLGLRVAGLMPGEAADQSIQSGMEPLYAAVGKAFGESQRLAAAVNWASLDGTLMAAKATAAGSDEIVASLAAIQNGFTQLKTVADRGTYVVGLVKAEILRAVAETTKIAFGAIPADADTVTVTPAGGEEASLVPASDDYRTSRPFGRRIDYLGMARRWVGVP